MLRVNTQMHPTIKRCLTHLEVLGTDEKTRQIVYMYMETLRKELNDQQQADQQESHPEE